MDQVCRQHSDRYPSGISRFVAQPQGMLGHPVWFVEITGPLGSRWTRTAGDVNRNSTSDACGVCLQVTSRWFLGRAVCDAWTTLDLICCTSSILHLLAISLDRYWAVTRLDYIHRRSTGRVAAMIAASWGGSVVISAPPLFIHDDDDSAANPDLTGYCVISPNLAYTVFSTVGAFYLPFALMMIIYVKVFLAARARIRRRLFRSRGAGFAAAAAAAAADDAGVLTRLTAAANHHGPCQPPSVTNGDVEVAQVELEVESAPPATHSETERRKAVEGGTLSGGCVSVVKSDCGVMPGEEPLVDLPADDDDEQTPVRATRHCSPLVGQAWSEIGAPAADCRRRVWSSHADVVDTVQWSTATAEDADCTAAAVPSPRSEMRAKRPLTLACSYNAGEGPTMFTDTPNTTVQHRRLIDDEVSAVKQPEENRSCDSDDRRLNGRSTELATGRCSPEGVDGLAVNPLCRVISPSPSSSVDRVAARSLSCDHYRCSVEGDSSAERRLCLPRKAADRLLTPTATPMHHRSSWADFTRTLLPSAAAFRVHFHVPSTREAGRTARQAVEQRRERKAARTLAIITGTFVLCWLPFFIVELLRPLCGERCHYPAPLISIIVWLGYVNSLLNPMIYTVFNADFRSAFRKILFGKYHRSWRR